MFRQLREGAKADAAAVVDEAVLEERRKDEERGHEHEIGEPHALLSAHRRQARQGCVEAVEGAAEGTARAGAPREVGLDAAGNGPAVFHRVAA